MSGGSYDYFYCKIDEFIGDIMIRSSGIDGMRPLRRAFTDHLAKVSAAAKAVEWVDSSDWGVEREEEAIRALLGDGVELAVVIERAQALHAELGARLEEAPTNQEPTKPSAPTEVFGIMETCSACGRWVHLGMDDPRTAGAQPPALTGWFGDPRTADVAPVIVKTRIKPEDRGAQRFTQVEHETKTRLMAECEVCEGTGEVERDPFTSADGEVFDARETCGDCEDGWVHLGWVEEAEGCEEGDGVEIYSAERPE